MNELPWIAEARKHIGMREIKGTQYNQTIVGWLKNMHVGTAGNKAWWAEDETPWCLSGDTEVLTDIGFVRFDEFKDLDIKKVAQLNRDTLEIEFVEDFQYIEKDYSGKLITVNRPGLGFSCDPNHRMFGYLSGNKKLSFIEISKLSTYGVGIPNIRSSNADADITDREIEYLAAFLSDGHYKGINPGFVKFKFSKERKMEKMEEWGYIDKKVEPKIYGVSKTIMTTYKVDIKNLRRDVFEEYKLLKWDFILSLSARQAELFIDTYKIFDGSQKQGEKSFTVFTADERLSDQLVYISTAAGYRTTPYKTKMVSRNSKIEFLYNIHVGASQTRYISHKHFEHSEYEGKLYCLSVPSSVIIIRCPLGAIIPIGNCGTFMGAMLKSANRYVVKDWFRASAWADPDMTKLSKPAYGAIAVLTRKGGGHVGFVVGKDDKGRIMLLGGNQSDAVNIAAFDPSRITGYYWPSKWDGSKAVKSVPAEGRYNLPLYKGTRLSTNES